MLKSVCIKAFLFCSLFFVTTVLSAQFRIVGYVQYWGRVMPDISKINFKGITHLNIAFVNPDSTGSLLIPAGFDTLVQIAHANKIKVLVSIGGGSFNPYYAILLSKDHLNLFIKELVKLVDDHQLDGIDVDLEGDAIDKNYDLFIVNLSAKLKLKGKLLTAAYATWNAQLISNRVLKKMDFINCMSYDQTGPWMPLEPGPHSTYIKAVEDLQYWTINRRLPKNKLNLGLPFYGYCFGTTYAESMSYATIVNTFSEAYLNDEVRPITGGIIYYNGLTTIKTKTVMALQNAGGVMIWQLLQDAAGDKSLLTAIDSLVENKVLKNRIGIVQ